MAEHTLLIDGMHCGSCVRRASMALAGAEGVEVKEVRIGAARIETGPDESAVDRAVEALAKAGYAAHVDHAAEPGAGL